MHKIDNRRKPLECTRDLIMVVDDDPIVLEMLSTFLRIAGFEAIAASNREDAMEKFKKVACVAVISDMSMSRETDGLELLEWIRKANSRIPVIIMSATSSQEIAADAIRKGAYTFIPKPFSLDILHSVICEAISDQRMRRIC